jgi:hypothetical protein
MYFSLLGATFGEALLRATESIMINGDIVTQWVEDQRRQGMIEGIAKGKAEGEVKATRDAILAVLAARGLAISAADRARVEACSDAVTLGRWHVRAVSAATTSDVFED